MEKWWRDMHGFQQVLFVIACATTIFMIVQIIMLAVGSGDNDATFDPDTDIGDTDVINNDVAGFSMFGLRLLSVRTVIAFFAIGSWVTLALFYAIRWWSILPGVAAGLLSAVGIAYFIKAVEKLQNDGTLQIKHALNRIGEVYLTIPAARQAAGKVNVNMQESYVELEAMTDRAEPLPTGARVKVVGILSDSCVLVEPLTAATEPTAAVTPQQDAAVDAQQELTQNQEEA